VKLILFNKGSNSGFIFEEPVFLIALYYFAAINMLVIAALAKECLKVSVVPADNNYVFTA
jgi:hypothetical protein